eukprot:g223.t1
MEERLLLAALKEFRNNANAEEASGAVGLLQRLVKNLLKAPDNPKYRRVRLENKLIKEKLLDVRGGRSALRGIGFRIDDSGEYYQYHDLGEDMLLHLLDLLVKFTVKEDDDETAKKNFLKRNAPRAADFQRYSTGLEGLKQRWTEVEFILRTSVNDNKELNAAEELVKASKAFTDLLEEEANRIDTLQGKLFQALLTNANETTIEGLDAETASTLRKGAAQLRQAIRVKIQDDADLDTARRALVDVLEFFKLLRSHANENDVDAATVLRNL